MVMRNNYIYTFKASQPSAFAGKGPTMWEIRNGLVNSAVTFQSAASGGRIIQILYRSTSTNTAMRNSPLPHVNKIQQVDEM